MKEIEKMLEEDIKIELTAYEEVIKEGEELREQLKNKYNTLFIYNTNEWIDFTDKITYSYYKLKESYGYKGGLEQVEKGVRNHYKKLQKKVEDKVGKILEISETTNGYDYSIKGENGSCEIEIISAGGYNIQKLHTRWIIKNVKAFN